MTDNTVKIFVYGLLQPEFQPPHSMTDSLADAILGDLYDLGEYPAAVNIGSSRQIIPGFVITVEASELPAIDTFEDIESGEYRRVFVTTNTGLRAFVYEYARQLPAHAVKIDVWR